jgi:hypothetical protein
MTINLSSSSSLCNVAMSPSPEASKMEEDQPQAGSSMQAELAPKQEYKLAELTCRRQRLAVDEKKRSQRMFGNILGTLNQFKKEDKSRNASEAVSAWGDYTDVRPNGGSLPPTGLQPRFDPKRVCIKTLQTTRGSSRR